MLRALCLCMPVHYDPASAKNTVTSALMIHLMLIIVASSIDLRFDQARMLTVAYRVNTAIMAYLALAFADTLDIGYKI